MANLHGEYISQCQLECKVESVTVPGPSKPLQKIGQEELQQVGIRIIKTMDSFSSSFQSLSVSIPVSEPIMKLTRMDRTEEVEICQKRKLRTTGGVF